MPRARIFLPSFLISVFALAGSFGCAPPSPNGASGAPAGSQAQPELTQAIIEERINDARVYDVPPETGTGGPIPWGFDEDEPKEIVVVDQQMDGRRATIVLDIKTQSSPRSRSQLYLAGQIRTMWELRTGWVLRRWEIVGVENISMKYRDIPKPPASSPGR